MAELRGTVERITFRNPENGFTVMRIRVDGGIETARIVGVAPDVLQGERVVAEGEWVKDPERGTQFQATAMKVSPPSGRAAIEAWLASGAIRGVGGHLASEIFAKFGDEVFEVMDREPQKLLTVPGIGKKKLKAIRESWGEQKASRELMIFLHEHGVPPARAMRIYKQYGADAIHRIRENPYRLADEIRGIGFVSADALAQRLGLAMDAMPRLRAGLQYALEKEAQSGHCAAPRERLIALAASLLGVPDALVSQALDEEIAGGQLINEPVGGKPAVFLRRLHHAETTAATRLLALNAGPPPWKIQAGKAIEWVEPKFGIQLSPSQRAAIVGVLGSKVSVITGGPGVGKTTIVRAVVEIVEAKKMTVMLAAPTGRAAKRLAESTGREARTIHRLLEPDPRTREFQKNELNPIDCDLLIVDESSMIDVPLLDSLLRAVRTRAGLLFVGDADQLPSVGPGQALADIIASEAIHVSRLEEIHRQASGSRIVVNAHRINRGELPIVPERGSESDFYVVEAADGAAAREKIVELIARRIPDRFGFDPLREIHVLAPMHRGEAGVQSLNAAIQAALNPLARSSDRLERGGVILAPGDKVMQTENDYERDIFNGDLGVVRRVRAREKKMGVEFDGRLVECEGADLDAISLAWATTIHKSQGTEYPAVIIALLKEHSIMLQRSLLYTAITRGRSLVIVVGQKSAIQLAVRNAASRVRYGKLRERLARC